PGEELLAGGPAVGIGGAVGGEQEAPDAAQTERIGVAEGGAQQLGRAAGVERGVRGRRSDLEDAQQIGDRGGLPQRLGAVRDTYGQAGARQQIGEVRDRGAGAAHHRHLVVLALLTMMEVAQGGAGRRGLVQRGRGGERQHASGEGGTRAGRGGGGAGARGGGAPARGTRLPSAPPAAVSPVARSSAPRSTTAPTGRGSASRRRSAASGRAPRNVSTATSGQLHTITRAPAAPSAT